MYIILVPCPGQRFGGRPPENRRVLPGLRNRQRYEASWVSRRRPSYRSQRAGMLCRCQPLRGGTGFVHHIRPRPAERWGSGGSSKRASCPALSYSVISLEGAVRYGGSNLQDHMRSPRRPALLLIRAHPAMKQPLHGAFGRRRRYWLRVVTRRRVVDDQFRLPGHLRLKTTQVFNHLARGRTRRRRHGGDGDDRFRCISD